MISNKAQRLFDRLEESGDSQALAVGECLRTISENGEESETDTYLAECADQIMHWAKYAGVALRKK